MVASDGDVTAEKADILPPRLAAWGMPHRGALVKAWCRQYNLAPVCLCTEGLAQCSALEAEIRYETRTARWPNGESSLRVRYVYRYVYCGSEHVS